MGSSGSLNQKQAVGENVLSSLHNPAFFPVSKLEPPTWKHKRRILHLKEIFRQKLLFLINRHSFDFLPPLTPANTSSPRRKSGYLNPPIFGPAVRHAAPSTRRRGSAPAPTQIEGRMLTDERLPIHEVPGIGEQINSSVCDLLHSAPASQRDPFP